MFLLGSVSFLLGSGSISKFCLYPDPHSFIADPHSFLVDLHSFFADLHLFLADMHSFFVDLHSLFCRSPFIFFRSESIFCGRGENSLIGFLSESLVFLRKNEQMSNSLKKTSDSLIFGERPEQSAHFW